MKNSKFIDLKKTELLDIKGGSIVALLAVFPLVFANWRVVGDLAERYGSSTGPDACNETCDGN